MKTIVVTPSFNHQVVKTLTKDQFLEQHPNHGHVWDELNEAKEPEKPKKAEKKSE